MDVKIANCIPFGCFPVGCSVCKQLKLFTGLHKFSLNGHGSDLAFVQLNSSVSSATCRIKATLTSGRGVLGSYPNSNGVGTEGRRDIVAFGTPGIDTAVPVGSGFSDDDDEYDFDTPTEGFASVPEAIEDVRNGKVVAFSVHAICLFLFSEGERFWFCIYELNLCFRWFWL